MEPQPAAPRKRRFVPKAGPRRVPKPEVKTEVAAEETDAEQARELLRRFNEGALRARPKVERKVAPTQIAFGQGGATTSMKLYGAPKGESNSSATNAGSSGLKMEKEYSSPWDQYSYYPVTLPLRPPYSGNPDIRNQEEFAESIEESTYDENSTKAADDLGLMEENKATSMFFLQLPPNLPTMKRSATANGHEAAKSTGPPGGARSLQKPCGLSELPAGLMGKMLVYKSGAIKMKLGDSLFDVSPGMNCDFAQDVMVINKAEKRCGVIGELNKRAIITPDIDSILESLDGL